MLTRFAVLVLFSAVAFLPAASWSQSQAVSSTSCCCMKQERGKCSCPGDSPEGHKCCAVTPAVVLMVPWFQRDFLISKRVSERDVIADSRHPARSSEPLLPPPKLHS